VRTADAAAAAVEDYYRGWASTGAPADGRAFLGAAASLLAEDATPTHLLGHLDGTWAVIHDRREDVHRRNQREVAEAAAALLARLDIDRLAASVYALGHLAETVTEALDPQVQAEIDSQVRAVTTDLPNQPEWQDLRDEMAAAGHHGTAEGVADAIAALADGMGRGIDWDLAFGDAYDAMEDGDLYGASDVWLSEMVGGLRTDLGRALAGAMTEGGSYEAYLAAAEGVLTAQPVKAVSYVVDLLTGRALTDGMLSVYRRVGASLVDWITAGDQRVCDICAGLESDSPYGLGDAPKCPAHGFCRCVLQAQDYPEAADIVGPYLTDDTEEG
jgi:hypothetical protein